MTFTSRAWIGAFLLCAFDLMASPAYAVEPIKVLLARGPGILLSLPVQALNQANIVMDNTPNLAFYDFESAATSAGPIEEPIVLSASCSGSASTPAATLLACAVAELADEREQHNADVVLLVVNNFNLCGAVPPDMMNRPSISQANSHHWFSPRLTRASSSLSAVTSA